MPRWLTDLNIREISFVDKGASGDAQDRPAVVFAKRKTTKEQTVPIKTTAAKKAPAADASKTGASPAEFAKAVQIRTVAKLGALPEGAQAELDAIMSKLDDSQKALLEMIFAQAGVGTKAPEAPAPTEGTAPEAPAPDMTKIAEEGTAPEVVEMLKSMSVRLAKAEKETADAKKQAAAADKRASDEVEKRRDTEMATYVQKNLSHIPGDLKELAKDLKTLEDRLDAQGFDRLKKRLESTSKMLEASRLLQEDGIGGAGGDAATGARGELEKIADEIRAKNPSLSKEQAFGKAVAANREVFKRMRKEEREAAH